MKRFVCVFILTAVIAAVALVNMPREFSALAEQLFEEGDVCVYCRSTELSSTDVGCGRIVHCSLAELKSVLVMCHGTDGVSVSFCGGEADLRRIARRLSLDNVQVQHLAELTVVCGYSRFVKGGVVLDGKQTNVQMALCHGVVTVGSPLILGEY